MQEKESKREAWLGDIRALEMLVRSIPSRVVAQPNVILPGPQAAFPGSRLPGKLAWTGHAHRPCWLPSRREPLTKSGTPCGGRPHLAGVPRHNPSTLAATAGQTGYEPSHDAERTPIETG